MKASTKARLINYERSTSWLQFYIYFRLPLGLIYNGLALLRLIFIPIQKQALTIVIQTFFCIFLILAFCESRNLKPLGYKFIHIMLPLEVISNAYSFNSPAYESEITLLLLSLIWWLPNAVYFKKRKSLFYDEPPVIRYSEKYGTKEDDNKPCTNNKENTTSEPLVIRSEYLSEDKGDIMDKPEKITKSEFKICKKCGEKLPESATFCSKCGKRICTKERKPIRKRKKIILFSGCLLICICAIAGSGIIGYEIGSKSGYDEGFISGRDDGYSEGHVKGYKKGLTEGRQEIINKNDDTYWKNRAQNIIEKNEEENLENTSQQIRKCASPGCDNVLNSSESGYCSIHKCSYKTCENERDYNCEYCRRHKCSKALCYEPRANDDSEYCAIHKCHVENCNLCADYDNIYCEMHKN